MKKFYQNVPSNVPKTDFNYSEIHCFYDNEKNRVFVKEYRLMPTPLDGQILGWDNFWLDFESFEFYIRRSSVFDDFIKNADFTVIPKELSNLF